jgi:flagellar hook-length control protein FliK
VDVRLRSTSQGVVATITAHQSEAVQTLQQAASDLRRSLEQQGVTLLQLDIGQSGERSAGRSGADAGGQAGGDRDGSDAGSAGASEDSPTQTTLQLPNGVLVDVLA